MMESFVAFGDIHGCFQAAETAVKIAEDFNARAVFLGDYVDRGPSATKTLKVLMDAKTNHPDWIFLRGNHDQMLIDLILGRSSTTEIGNVLGMEFGYEQASKSFQEWQNLMKHDRNEVLSFLEGTQFFYETEEFIFCHAVLRENNNSIESKAPEELMWNYSYEPIWRGKKFVHGHLPVKVPTITRQGININTECGYGGELTGFYYGAQNQIIRYYRIKENGQLINK